MKNRLVQIARKLTGFWLFKKSLPPEFSGEKVYVTSRADIRMLAPGLDASCGDLFQVVNNYVSKGDIVWDIGSNLGVLSFSSAMKAGKDGAIFSLEADPRYADIQTRTLKQFTDKAAQISILCAAVADSFGILDFAIPKKGHARNHLAKVAGNSAGETEMTKQVVTLTLDWLLDYWKAPNFVKIDVEGAECLVMQGAHKLFSEVRPIAYIECSPHNAEELTAFLKEKKYTLFAIDHNGNESEVDEVQFNTIAKPG